MSEKTFQETFGIKNNYAEKAKPVYNVYVSTTAGKVRPNNEDNFAINTVFRPLDKPVVNLKGQNAEEPILCAVFDGMGGEAMGGEASLICAETSKKLYEGFKKYPLPIDKAFDAFATDCNNKINAMLKQRRLRRGGSTFVMALFSDDCVYTASMGDSRIYLLRGETLEQISRDHTLAMKKYYANIYTLEEALSSPDSHKLTSFLGMDTDGEGLCPEKYDKVNMKIGEKLLLCSDGLYDMISDSEICEILSRESDTISYDLVKAAMKNGGVDNITCMVIERA